MSEKIDRLEEAVKLWHERAKTELEAEASFLERVRDSGDAVRIAEAASSTRYSELIADTIAELAGP